MNVLGAIAALLTGSDVGLDYEFAEYTGQNSPKTYWVGEYIEEPVTVESGLIESEFILTGYNRGDFTELEQGKTKIRNKFFLGHSMILGDGTGLWIGYNKAVTIPTQDENLNRLEISLNVKTWRV